MALDLPETATVISAFEFVRYLDEDGEIKSVYGLEGIAHEELIGSLIAVIDRERDILRYGWDIPADEVDDEAEEPE